MNQTVLNNTSTAWLDWHVDILNGVIDRTEVNKPVVHKVEADSSNWQVQYIHNAGYTDGFGAVWMGGSTSVGTGNSLSVRFTWRPDGSGLPVTIHQYPTSTGEFIPEPSSLLALAGSLSTLGLALYRRKR